MSFDSSRFTFDHWNDFFGVVMQQGRPQLDSDWNEWLAEFARRIRAGTLDMFGRAVVPMTTPNGFQITLSQDSSGMASIGIGLGRIYVDGLLAENHGLPRPDPTKWIPPASAAVAAFRSALPKFLLSPVWDPALDELEGQVGINYEQQPYYPNASAVAPFPQAGGPYLIYLDVWQREVTFLEDPDLIEKAVGVDTTGRLQTAWQVKWLDVSSVNAVNCSTKDADLPAAWQNLLLPPGPRLTTGVIQSTPSGPCCLTSNTGYTGQENQLYRVEIHQPGNVGAATFKWSRDNASVATAVTAITQAGRVLTVQSTGKDDVLRFSPNDWVEITDDWLELNGLPGELHIVSAVSDAEKTVTLVSAVSATSFPVDSTGQTEPTRHTRLVRWDQSGKVFQSDGVTVWTDLGAPGSLGDIKVPPSGTTLILENGITVSFDLAPNASLFRTRDNWEFAARTSDGAVEFLDSQPPRGDYHHYARLAVTKLSGGQLAAGVTLTLDDLSEPPIAFLNFQATSASGWPANFGVAARANPVTPSNFDLEVAYNPAAAQGVTLPVTVELFSDLSLDLKAANYAPNVINNSSNLIAIPASYSPPSTAPVFPQNFSASPTPLATSGTIQLQDSSSPPIAFLTLQTTPIAKWPANFFVFATPFGAAGNFNLEVVYEGSPAGSPVTLEQFQNLSLNTVASQVTSQFITQVATPLRAPFPTLNLIRFTDCRAFWPPSFTQAAPALHVTGISWTNDDVMALDTFLQGLQITLDGPPAPASISASSMIVTLEVPQTATSPVGSPVTELLSEIVEIQGSPTVTANKITWIVPTGAAFPITVPMGARYRVRVHLMGRFIWGKQNNTLIYLDGQAFGTFSTGMGGERITTLTLPSGNAARASDFQSWFWLTPTVPLTFTVAPTIPLPLRSEGLTEVVSDIVLTGTGGTPTAAGSAVPLVNITVTLNVAVTDRALSTAAPFLLDAVLLIDDPTMLNASPASGLTGAGGNGLDFKKGEATNLILGQFIPTGGSAAVTFLNVPIDAPGAGTRTLRITNLRANATAVASTPGGPAEVLALISAAGSIAVPIKNPSAPVGFVEPAVSAAVVSTLPSGGIFTIDPASGVNQVLATNPTATGAINVVLQFRGAFPGAFKPRTFQQSFTFGAPYFGEETFDRGGLPVAPSSPALNVLMGRADQGTQFVARLQNIPPQVQVFVTTRDVPPGGLTGGNPDTPAALAILKTPSTSVGTTPGGVPLGTGGKTSGVSAGIPIAQVPTSSGAGEAVWEWVGPPQSSLVQTLEFGVVLAMPAGAGAAPAATPPAVNLSLGPLSRVATASESDPVPRFADTSKPLNLFAVVVGAGGAVP